MTAMHDAAAAALAVLQWKTEAMQFETLLSGYLSLTVDGVRFMLAFFAACACGAILRALPTVFGAPRPPAAHLSVQDHLSMHFYRLLGFSYRVIVWYDGDLQAALLQATQLVRLGIRVRACPCRAHLRTRSGPAFVGLFDGEAPKSKRCRCNGVHRRPKESTACVQAASFSRSCPAWRSASMCLGPAFYTALSAWP